MGWLGAASDSTGGAGGAAALLLEVLGVLSGAAAAALETETVPPRGESDAVLFALFDAFALVVPCRADGVGVVGSRAAVAGLGWLGALTAAGGAGAAAGLGLNAPASASSPPTR